MMYIFQPIILLCLVGGECNQTSALMTFHVGHPLQVSESDLSEVVLKQCFSSAEEVIRTEVFDKAGKIFAQASCERGAKRSKGEGK